MAKTYGDAFLSALAGYKVRKSPLGEEMARALAEGRHLLIDDRYHGMVKAILWTEWDGGSRRPTVVEVPDLRWHSRSGVEIAPSRVVMMAVEAGIIGARPYPEELLAQKPWLYPSREGWVYPQVRVLTTEEVAAGIARFGAGQLRLEVEPYPGQPAWAPIAGYAIGGTSGVLGGDLPLEPEVVVSYDDTDETYQKWYDLEKVPVGGYVYFLPRIWGSDHSGIWEADDLLLFWRKEDGWWPFVGNREEWANPEFDGFLSGVQHALYFTHYHKEGSEAYRASRNW